MKATAISLVAYFMALICWSQTAQEMVGKMSEIMDGFNDYQVAVSSEFWVKGPKAKDKATSSSKILTKGLKQYIETTGKDTKGNLINRLQVFDENTSYDFDRVKGVIRKVDLSKTGEDILEKLKELQNPTNLGLLGELKYSMEEKEIEGRQYYVLTLVEPITVGNQSFDKVVFWIDAESYLLYKTEMETVTKIKVPFGDSVVIKQGAMQEFTDWKVNAGIPDYRFSLSIPEGVKVIDETERAREVVQILKDQREKKEAVKEKLTVAERVKARREEEGAKDTRNGKSE